MAGLVDRSVRADLSVQDETDRRLDRIPSTNTEKIEYYREKRQRIAIDDEDTVDVGRADLDSGVCRSSCGAGHVRHG